MPEQQAKILIVDDDTAHRTMLLTMLEDWGYTVYGAADGDKAVAECTRYPFDLVLMDVRMPGKSGSDALREIKQYNPAIPVLMMTAYSNIESAVQAIKDGAYDYVTKPLDFEKLKVSVHNAIEHTNLKQENSILRQDTGRQNALASIVGQSPPMLRLLEMLKTVAPSDATVLISGESGTGKEVIARAIHKSSNRVAAAYVAFNCAALSESLIESELFGHEKGAFTGADRKRDGRITSADKGTLFLDEIGEMPLAMQAKLLRVLQEREVQPVGSNKPVPVDVRIIAASNRNLAGEVEAGNFREDLYYRLNVVEMIVPPLRERQDDIPLLAQFFLNNFAKKNNKVVQGFTPLAMDGLLRYQWPGNVRELENAIERAVILLFGDYISEKELPPQIFKNYTPQTESATMQKETRNLQGLVETQKNISTPVKSLTESIAEGATLKDLEKERIFIALQETGGNKSEAAKRLGISRKTLHLKLQKYENPTG